MIELASVLAGYGGGDVLQGVDLVVPAGSITCIVGPNGAGKSTVLRCLSGLLPAATRCDPAGRHPIQSLSPAEVIAAGVVQVPQQDGLFGNLTVRDNMLLGGYLIRRDRTRLRRRLAELAEAFPIIAERARRPGGRPVRRPAPDRRVRTGDGHRAEWCCSTSRPWAWTRAPARGRSRPPGPSTSWARRCSWSSRTSGSGSSWPPTASSWSVAASSWPSRPTSLLRPARHGGDVLRLRSVGADADTLRGRRAQRAGASYEPSSVARLAPADPPSCSASAGPAPPTWSASRTRRATTPSWSTSSTPPWVSTWRRRCVPLPVTSA